MSRYWADIIIAAFNHYVNVTRYCIKILFSFDVLLTVHFSIFILVINQLGAQNFCFSSLNLCTGWPPIGVTIPEAI